ncbi:glycosyltransferase family 2 protein [Paenarthrobacter nicotinovorans]|uniref:glycosyltransferase family 2 protein n=1 Tax=Paenarthrobacter nicotinovorans TaxID=29320 RepID=UPI003A7FC461
MIRPRFTVICPAYNRSAPIAATIESVLKQTRGDFELLVGSDGSTDDTDDIVAGFARADSRVKLVRLAHTGDPGLVRNRLCGQAGQGYVAYIDHDDVWREDHLAVLGSVLDSGAEWAASGGDYRHDDGSSTILGGRSLLWHPELAVVDPYAEPSRVAHRMPVLTAAGGWRRAARGLEDWDLWWRMSSRGAGLQPVDETTAVVSISGTTRRHTLDHHLVVPLAGTASASAARAAVEDWSQARLAEVFAADFLRWAGEIDLDPLVMLPLANNGSGGCLPEETAERPGPSVSTAPHMAFTVGAFPGGHDGWLVGIAAPVVSRGHRQAMQRVLRTRFREAMGRLESGVSLRCGGIGEQMKNAQSKRGNHE